MVKALVNSLVKNYEDYFGETTENWEAEPALQSASSEDLERLLEQEHQENYSDMGKQVQYMERVQEDRTTRWVGKDSTTCRTGEE